MNYIIIDKSCMSSFRDAIIADTHKHLMLQLFFAINGELIINVAGNEIKSKCVVVNTDIEHSFHGQNKKVFTMLIDAISPLALQIKEKYIKDKEYHILDNAEINKMQINNLLSEPISIKEYEYFVSSLFNALDIKNNSITKYNERILKVLEQLKFCDCSDHSINEIAKNVFISPSRLSHHFKEQTGMPLRHC